MRIKILLLSFLFAGSSWGTDYVFPGTATAPLILQNNDTLTVNSGTFNGGSTFTLENSTTTLGQSVTIQSGATLSSSAFAIYAPYDGPFTIINNGALTGGTAAVMGTGAHITLTQSSTTPISGLLDLGPFATVNFNSSAGSDNFLYVGQNSTINFNSTGSPASGIIGATGTILNTNHTITLAPTNAIDTININSGTTSLGNVTNLGKALNVASGATLALGSSTMSGAGTITQAGTFTSANTSALTALTGVFTTSGTTTFAGQSLNNDFRVTGGTTTVTGVGSFIINNTATLSGGNLDAGQTFLIINNNATLHQTGGVLKVNSSGVSGSFQIASGATYQIDEGTFERGAAGASTFSTNSTYIQNGGTVNFANNLTTNSCTFIVNGGTFNYTASGAINVNGGTYTQTGGSFIATNSGGIFANPNTTINVSGGTLNFSNTLFVDNNVTVNLSRQPNIYLDGGVTFLSSVGNSVNLAFGSSFLPLINMPNDPADFSDPVVNITNNSNLYVAAGKYIFLDAGGPITVGTVALPANNQFVQYSLGAAAGGFGEQAFVIVTRTGLNTLATTGATQNIGNFLDLVATSTTSNQSNALLFTALSNLQNEGTTNLDQNLFELSPQVVTSFPMIATVDMLLQQIDTRLLAKRKQQFYAAGDDDYRSDFWIAPLGAYGHQNNAELLFGYTTQSAGITIGAERKLCAENIIGLAGSYVNGRIKPIYSDNSHTTIHSYQLTSYGTYSFIPDQYWNWLFAFNNSANFSKRNIDLVNANATAKYDANLYAAKLIYSEDMHVTKDTTISPELNMFYVHLHQQGYNESGADGLDYNVSATNTSLLRFGVGGWITFMQQTRCSTIVPQIYGAITYDVKAASQNISANLVNTTPIFSSAAGTPRWGGIAAGKLTFKLKNNLDLVADLNVQVKSQYYETFGDLRLQYYF